MIEDLKKGYVLHFADSRQTPFPAIFFEVRRLEKDIDLEAENVIWHFFLFGKGLMKENNRISYRGP